MSFNENLKSGSGFMGLITVQQPWCVCVLSLEQVSDWGQPIVRVDEVLHHLPGLLQKLSVNGFHPLQSQSDLHGAVPKPGQDGLRQDDLYGAAAEVSGASTPWVNQPNHQII